MTELKTLIDFRCKCVSCTGNIEQDCISDETLVSMQELKQEAIKHIKSGNMVEGAKLWAINFFNITEEELK